MSSMEFPREEITMAIAVHQGERYSIVDALEAIWNDRKAAFRAEVEEWMRADVSDDIDAAYNTAVNDILALFDTPKMYQRRAFTFEALPEEDDGFIDSPGTRTEEQRSRKEVLGQWHSKEGPTGEHVFTLQGVTSKDIRQKDRRD